MTEYAFAPSTATTKQITASTVTASVALPALDASPNDRTVRVYNSTAVVVFITFGTSATSALVTGIPIPPGGVETFDVPGEFTHVAGITSAGGGTVYFTEGMGDS